MTDPDNIVNRTIEAERVTGIKYGTGATGQQGLASGYYNVRPASRMLAATIRWLWRRARRR